MGSVTLVPGVHSVRLDISVNEAVFIALLIGRCSLSEMTGMLRTVSSDNLKEVVGKSSEELLTAVHTQQGAGAPNLYDNLCFALKALP